MAGRAEGPRPEYPRGGSLFPARGGAASADELIGYVDFGAQSITDATLNITQTNQLTITAS